MKNIKCIRLTLLGATALLTAACSNRASITPSVTLPGVTSPATDGAELTRIADALAKAGDHRAAIPIYRHLAEKNGNTYALSALASSFMALGDYDKAETVLTKLASNNPANSDAYYNLGKVRLAKGQFEAALDAFNMASQAPDGAKGKSRSGRAVALATLGRTAEAFQALGDSEERTDLSNMALILAANNYTAAAIKTLEPLVQKSGNTSRDRQNLAMAYLLHGNEQAAYDIARLDLDPVSINETFTFYRSLKSLEPAQRMQALVTGTVNPDWSRRKMANLSLQETEEQQQAANRLVEKNTLARAETNLVVAEAPEATQPEQTRAAYELTEIPPLVEPEGWALQIGAYRTIKNLMRGWTILYRQSGDLLQDIPPRRSEVDFGNGEGKPSGFYYRLNAGPLKTLQHARELCKALRERGTRCWIRPPETEEGKLPGSMNARQPQDASQPVLAKAPEENEKGS